MQRWSRAIAIATLVLAAAGPASGAVNVERRGDENPMAVIAKSTAWGMLTGVLIGGAIGLAANTDSDAPMRWSVVAGTFTGLGVGFWHVSHRAEPGVGFDGTAMPSGGLRASGPARGGVRVRAVTLRF